jgi:hypothetical protein
MSKKGGEISVEVVYVGGEDLGGGFVADWDVVVGMGGMPVHWILSIMSVLEILYILPILSELGIIIIETLLVYGLQPVLKILPLLFDFTHSHGIIVHTLLIILINDIPRIGPLLRLLDLHKNLHFLRPLLFLCFPVIRLRRHQLLYLPLLELLPDGTRPLLHHTHRHPLCLRLVGFYGCLRTHNIEHLLGEVQGDGVLFGCVVLDELFVHRDKR